MMRAIKRTVHSGPLTAEQIIASIWRASRAKIAHFGPPPTPSAAKCTPASLAPGVGLILIYKGRAASAAAIARVYITQRTVDAFVQVSLQCGYMLLFGNTSFDSSEGVYTWPLVKLPWAFADLSDRV